MTKKAYLVLEDGAVFEGTTFGAEKTAYGEVVFDTAMAGYQEMLTDPSFSGQIVVPTYPLIGNYGINDFHFESKKIQVRGFVVREHCPLPSHWQDNITIDQYLKLNFIPGVSGVDTRALTRHIRSSGTMMGVLTSEMSEKEALERLQKFQRYGATDFVKEVSTEKQFDWECVEKIAANPMHIAVVDMGLKYNIARLLCQLDCKVTIFPVTCTAEDVLSCNPDGILLSPGPGDPALLDYAIAQVKQLIYKKPVMGICLGHQLIALSLGANTYKLKFGHRGGNHPVRDLKTGRIFITTQNHGYAVDESSVKGSLEISHMNSNDNTVEGLRHKDLPVMSVQYHSEGAPGPEDNTYLFKQFLDMIKKGK